ncbi:GlsB/YeaQ/YmgE family stress response membrane protein [Escherichia coli]|uniref:GlsB/YeaQ/YmgE family stress response membrane protein n=1 Tax=Escherichia coli TaxID=562 RepID=UPI0038B67179
MGILSWIIFGLIAGILAKWIMPGKDGGGFFMTILLGIVGAVVGGWISTLFGFGKVDGFNFGSFVVAVCIDSLEVRKKPGGHWIIRYLAGLDLVGLASL